MKAKISHHGIAKTKSKWEVVGSSGNLQVSTYLFRTGCKNILLKKSVLRPPVAFGLGDPRRTKKFYTL